jgi:hypothetical protein
LSKVLVNAYPDFQFFMLYFTIGSHRSVQFASLHHTIRKLVGCGRTTSFCTSCTRLFRLFNTQSKALRAPRPLQLCCSSLSVRTMKIFNSGLPRARLVFYNWTIKTVHVESTKKCSSKISIMPNCKTESVGLFKCQNLLGVHSVPLLFLNRILSRKFLTDQTPNLQIIPAVTVFL